MSAERFPDTRSVRAVRTAPRAWISFVAAAVYVAVAAGVANVLTDLIPTGDPVEEFVLGHVTVLIPLIVAGVVFVHWAGWNNIVWRLPSAAETTPRRWWLLAFPALMLVQYATVLVDSRWSAWDLGSVVIVAIVCLLIGFGEELYFRGILRASIRHRHGETLALLLTSLAFGLAHTLGAVLAGVEPAGIAFEIGVTALAGAICYGAYRATGRLWVPILLHALDDFSLQISSGDLTADPSDAGLSPLGVTAQTLLWILALALLISCIRQDLRGRAPRS